MPRIEDEFIRKHYSTRLQEWIDEYENPSGYPFTRIRLTRVIKYLKDNAIQPQSILDIGCGVGIPSMEIAQPTCSIYGFDLSPELVDYACARAKRLNLSAEYIVGSVTDPSAYPDRLFELVIAFGVFQHITDDLAVLSHIKQHLAPNGLVVLSLRNPLFALTTFNRPSYELFAELFKEFLQSKEGLVLDNFLKSKFDLSLPPLRSGGESTPHLDDLVYKYHNPLTVKDLLAQVTLTPIHMDFYRHHALPPMLEQHAPERFKTLSLELDARVNDWRSMFLCSTYLVYCRHTGEK